MKAESDAAQAHSYAQITNLAAENKQMLSMFELIISRLPERPGDAPAATPPPPATPAATPTPHQQNIAHAKQRFDEQATFDAAVDAAVARSNANAAHAARGAATSTPPPPRAASYSSAAAPRAPAGYRVPAPPPPPPPPPPPAFSYANGPISSTDRPAPVKSFTLLMVKCLKIDLIPAGMETQTCAIISFMHAHNTRLEDFLKMDDSTFDERRRLGGNKAEWLVATDATIANAIQGSFERSSTHVQNFISEFSLVAELVTSGRALLKHFMRLYNAESGFEEYQAEEDLKAFPHFTMGANQADSVKHGYGLVGCFGRLPTTRLLEPPGKLKGQTRLLLNKLPDALPGKQAALKKFFQDGLDGVTRWATIHAVIKSIAFMLGPDVSFAPVGNAAFAPRGCWICASPTPIHSARNCTEKCPECSFKFCPAAKPGTPRAPCAVNASTAPEAHKVTNALGGRLPDAIFQGLLERCWWIKHPSCWRVGFPRGLFPPLGCFPPRCLGAVAPPVPLSRVAASYHGCVTHCAFWRQCTRRLYHAGSRLAQQARRQRSGRRRPSTW